MDFWFFWLKITLFDMFLLFLGFFLIVLHTNIFTVHIQTGDFGLLSCWLVELVMVLGIALLHTLRLIEICFDISSKWWLNSILMFEL